jgi:hypothetical protein
MTKKVYPISDASGAYNDASCDRHNIVWSSEERRGRGCPACKAEEKLYRLEKKLARLRELLVTIEWSATVDGDPACPICSEFETHAADCKLVALKGETK